MLKNSLICLFLSFWLIFSDSHASARAYGDIIKDFVEERHPTLSLKPFSWSNEKILGVFRDKTDLTIERLYLAKGTPPEFLDFKEDFIYTAKAETIYCTGGRIICGNRLDGTLCFYNADKEEFVNLDHPERAWNYTHFDDEGKVIFAYSMHKGYAEYWTNRSGDWTLLGKGKNCQLQWVSARSTEQWKRFDYLCSYHDDDTATFHLLKGGALLPTNLARFPLTVALEPEVIVDAKDPKTVICVLQNRAGYMDIDFLVNSEINKERLASMIYRVKEKKLMPDVLISMNLDALKISDQGLLTKISFDLGGYRRYSGCVEEDSSDGNVTVRWNIPGKDTPSYSTPPDTLNFHPPLHLVTMPYEESQTFYLYSRNANPSGTTIVMVEGGPHIFYQTDFRMMAHEWCTKQGHTLIFPQETLRTGYGYSHYKAGLGEMDQGNLRQIIAMVQHGLKSRLIPDIHNIHLWGHSYGGSVAAWMALRFNEIMGTTEPSFVFKTITAESPCMFLEMGPSLTSWIKSEKDLTESDEEWSRRISPISYVENPLAAPFLIITDAGDVRCQVSKTTCFAEALSHHPNMAYMKHTLPEDFHVFFVKNEADLDVKFPILDGWIKGVPTNGTQEQLTEKGIEIVLGEKLLLASD